MEFTLLWRLCKFKPSSTLDRRRRVVLKSFNRPQKRLQYRACSDSLSNCHCFSHKAHQRKPLHHARFGSRLLHSLPVPRIWRNMAGILVESLPEDSLYKHCSSRFWNTDRSRRASMLLRKSTQSYPNRWKSCALVSRSSWIWPRSSKESNE